MSELPAVPQSPDAEKGLISSFVLAPKEVGMMCLEKTVTPKWFLTPAMGEFFQVLSEIHESGATPDFITVAQTLKNRGKLESCGGPIAVNELFRFVPSAANAAQYLEIVHEKHLLREVIRVCNSYAAQSMIEQEDAPGLLANLHSDITSLIHKRSKRSTIREDVRAILIEITSGQPDGTLLLTGMQGVDGRLNLYRGDSLVISAPTSCGKSSLAANILINCAKRGLRCAFYPLESRQKQVLKRVLAQMSGYNAEFVRKLACGAVGGTNAQAEASHRVSGEFAKAAQTLVGLNIHMRDDLHYWEEIEADIRAESANGAFDFVVIDYLQLIRTRRKFDRRQLEIACLTQSAKILANETNSVVCIPSQVNKAGGTREAEDAENDASALIKIHAEQNDNGDIHPGRVEVWKQREGQRHIDLPLKFNGLLTRFEYHESTSHITI